MSGHEAAEDALRLGGLGYYQWDAKTGNVHANDVMFAIWGVPKQDVAFHTPAVLAEGAGEQIYTLAAGKFAELMQRVHPDDVRTLKEAGDALLATSAPVTTEYRFRRDDGGYRTVRRRARLDRDAAGAPVRILALVEDISLATADVASKRIVQHLLDVTLDGALSSEQLREHGKRLVLHAGTSDTAALLDAFAHAGLGTLSLAETSTTRWTFRSKDLQGAQRRSRMTTCGLALGFVEAVVATGTRKDALGTETKCRRRGDAECEFVVAAR